MLTAAIAVALGFGRVWFQSQWPCQIDRALATCDAVRVAYPSRGPDGTETTISFEVTTLDEIRRIRTLLDLPAARKVTPGNVILGGPSIEVTLFERGKETTAFHLIDSLLVAPNDSVSDKREYGLASYEAWCVLLEMGERQSATRGTRGPH